MAASRSSSSRMPHPQAGNFTVRNPADLTIRQLERIVLTVQALLWLDYDGGWDPDKDLGSDFIAEVTHVMTNAGLAPSQQPNPDGSLKETN